jgi:DNA-binding NtrC family response regulator
LDELGELPLDLQAKLLRALEKQEFRRVGGSRTIKVDVRLVAATNRDLAKEVNQGSFRADLYYRLAVVRVRIPALRERTDDVPLLVEHFVRQTFPNDPTRIAAVLDSINPENWRRLETYAWPGNVRELRNVVHRTIALGEPPLDDRPVPAAAPSHAAEASAQTTLDARSLYPALDLGRPFLDQKKELLATFERVYLTEMLKLHEGKVSRAAKAAGIDRMYFKRMLTRSSD